MSDESTTLPKPEPDEKKKPVPADDHYVFQLTKRGKPMGTALNKVPFTKREAQSFARLHAKAGDRDHAVVTDPRNKTTFRVVTVYEGGTGDNRPLIRS